MSATSPPGAIGAPGMGLARPAVAVAGACGPSVLAHDAQRGAARAAILRDAGQEERMEKARLAFEQTEGGHQAPLWRAAGA